MTPEVGLVIRHIYLWRDEQKRGQIEGRKARPCLIIHTRLNEHGEIEVYICPVTHTQPENSNQSIEISLATKQRLKLDNQRSWIVSRQKIWDKPAGKLRETFMYYSLVSLIHTVS